MSSISRYVPYQDSIKLLEKVKDILLIKGWGQGSYYQIDNYKKCNFCLSGALIEVDIDHFDNFNAAYRTATTMLNDICGGNMVRYNDKKGRTKEEVIAKIDEAIQALRNAPATL